jgi:hypothetical protein
MTNGRGDNKDKYGFLVVVIGMILGCSVFIVAIFKYSTAQDITPLTTLIGTLAGAFFGQQVGSSGKDKAVKQAYRQGLLANMKPEEAKPFIEFVET